MNLRMPRRTDTVALIALLAAAWSVGPAQAQTCASPLTFSSGGETTGDTCLGGYLPWNFGGLVSQHRKIVYRFDPSLLAEHRLRFEAVDFDMTALVSNVCDQSPPVYAAADVFAGRSGELPLTGVPSGPLYLFVTAQPDFPYETCGRYTLADLDPRIFTDEAGFRGLLQPGYYEESFQTFPPGATPQRMDFSGGGYGYTATPLGRDGQLIAPNLPREPLRALAAKTSWGPVTLKLTSTGAPIHAVGGRFWKTTAWGVTSQDRMTVSLRSGTRVTSYQILGSSSRFRGFYSARPIDEITINLVGTGQPTIDDLIVGQLQP